jgi:hypothetical protein
LYAIAGVCQVAGCGWLLDLVKGFKTAGSAQSPDVRQQHLTPAMGQDLSSQAQPQRMNRSVAIIEIGKRLVQLGRCIIGVGSAVLPLRVGSSAYRDRIKRYGNNLLIYRVPLYQRRWQSRSIKSRVTLNFRPGIHNTVCDMAFRTAVTRFTKNMRAGSIVLIDKPVWLKLHCRKLGCPPICRGK